MEKEEQARIAALLTRLDMGMATHEEMQSAFAMLLRMMWSREDLKLCIAEQIKACAATRACGRDWFGLASRILVMPWPWFAVAVAVFSPNFPALVIFIEKMFK